MKIFNYTTPLSFMQNNQREVLRYKYLNHDKSVQAILTVDKKTQEFISYDTFTPEKPYDNEYENNKTRVQKPVKKSHKPGDEFTTRYLKPDLQTVELEVRYRWLDDNEYEVVEVIKHDKNR